MTQAPADHNSRFTQENSAMRIHRLFLIHGAGGAGKSTLMQEIRRIEPSVSIHIKDSDRPRRPSETGLDISGDIHFVTSREEVENQPEQYAVIYYRYGNVYGIRQDQLAAAFTHHELHFIIVSDIGAIRKLKEMYEAKAIHMHSDPSHLPQQLSERDDAEQAERLRCIEVQQKEYVENNVLFDYVVINFWERPEESVRQLENIILHCRWQAMRT